MNRASAKAVALGAASHKRLSLVMERLNNIIGIQSQHGNWDCNPYMLGMLNGLLVAKSLFTDECPLFKEAPEQWLDDRIPDVSMHPVIEASLLLSRAEEP